MRALLLIRHLKKPPYFLILQDQIMNMASNKAKPTSPRPGIRHTHSHYVQMLLHQDTIPHLHNVLAALLVWLLLAGFLVFPGTFSRVRESMDKKNHDDDNIDGDEDDEKKLSDKAAKTIMAGVRNMPLLVVAAVICGIAALGMLALAIRHRRNYVWVINRLLVPGMANSLAGILSTLIGVYTQQEGIWSITAKVTGIVEGAYLVVCGGLFVIVEAGPLRQARKRHETHYEGWFGASDGGSLHGGGKDHVRVESQAVV